MKDIFHDLYTKVLSFFIDSKEEQDPTKGVAINRLKTVLMQDRAGFSERAIQMMKEELVSVVSKYMEIDDENFQLQIDALEEKTVLDLSIPVVRPKTDEEIDAAIKEQDLKNQKKAEQIVTELENLIKEKAVALADGVIDKELLEQAQKNIKEKETETETANEEEQKEEQEIEKTPESSEPAETPVKEPEKKSENKSSKESEKEEKEEKSTKGLEKQ